MIPELQSHFPDSEWNVLEETDRGRIARHMTGKSSAHWSRGEIKGTGYTTLATFSPQHKGDKRTAIVCKTELTITRPYNSELDYATLCEAVRSVGRAGGFLTAAKEALERDGVSWPENFNTDRSEPAEQINRDCVAALGEVCEAHGKPIDPESGRPPYSHRPGYCGICNVGHKTLPPV